MGAFPHYGGRWAEWNGYFRDSVRQFIKARMLACLARALWQHRCFVPDTKPACCTPGADLMTHPECNQIMRTAPSKQSALCVAQ